MVSHHQLHALLTFLIFIPTSNSDLVEDRAALFRLRDAVRGSTLRWNTTSSDPCTWEGVTCNTTINGVTALRLPGDGLSGQLPLNSIGSLTQLRNLSLRHNSLSGPLPSDLGSCKELQYLYLQDNNFSGDIPVSFFSLNNLVRVNLAGNNLSGVISTDFNNLTELRNLNLEKNHFTDSLPDFNSLNHLREFNVSFNNLTGSIPWRLRSFSSESFLGNSLCGDPLDSCPNGDSSSSSSNNLSGGAIAGIVVGSVFGLLLILVFLIVLLKKGKAENTSRQAEMSPFPPSPVKPPEYEYQNPKPIIVIESNSSGNSFSGRMAARPSVDNVIRDRKAPDLVFFGDSIEVFTLEELLRSSAEVLGKGTLGTTYKAYLESGIEVVVKRLKKVCVSEAEFTEKVEEMGGYNHDNLVPVRAYFYGREEKLLVFDSMPMGSLSELLHGNRGADRANLSWEIRSRIALGAARGIEYLHSVSPGTAHGNIKSSNILLRDNYEVTISDYGITQLVSSNSSPNLIAYRAPEVQDSRFPSQKSDVYSYGVLILEILTAKDPDRALNEEGIELVSWVHSAVQEGLTMEVFDPELLRDPNPVNQMVQLLNVAIICTSQLDPRKRPSMVEVSRQIKGICN